MSKCNLPNWRNCTQPDTCCNYCTELSACVQSCAMRIIGKECVFYTDEKAPGGLLSKPSAKMKYQNNNTTKMRSEQEIRYELDIQLQRIKDHPYSTKQIKTIIDVLEWVLGEED